MRKKFLYRSVMMSSGILAVMVILLSHVFHNEVQNRAEKSRTEQSNSDAPTSIVSVPADAVTSSPVGEVNEQVPSLLEVFDMNEQENESPVIDSPQLVRYIKTLFRAIISPNAP